MKKKIISVMTASALAFTYVPALAIELTSNAACVIDCTTGQTLYELNQDEPLAPASMTKVMTTYIIYEKIKDGFLAKDTVITADSEDEAASKDTEASNVYLTAGTGYTVDELIGAILVPSACAVCEMVGKHISGSKEAFAALMNEYVGKLGLEAYYEDASGLSDNNRISARSMAKLAQILITEHPDVLSYTSKSTITFDGKTYSNTNKMLPGRSYEYPGTDGLKTGTTNLAGSCFTGTSVNNGNRIISVTMHSESNSCLFSDTKKLMDFGFDYINYYYYNIFNSDMRLFINGSEIPAFSVQGQYPGMCFIIEDLKNYGFDILWDNDTRTVSAVHNKQKPLSPIPMDYYRTLEPGEVFSPIIKDSEIQAEIILADKKHIFKGVFPIGSYTAVSADELINVAKSVFWDNEERCLDITL